MVSCAARSERVTSSETEWLITSHSLRRNLLSSISSLFQDMDLYIYIYTRMQGERLETTTSSIVREIIGDFDWTASC